MLAREGLTRSGFAPVPPQSETYRVTLLLNTSLPACLSIPQKQHLLKGLATHALPLRLGL